MAFENLKIQLFYNSKGELIREVGLNKIPLITKMSNLSYDIELFTPIPFDAHSNFSVAFEKADGTITSPYELAHIGTKSVKLASGEIVKFNRYVKIGLPNEVFSISSPNYSNKLIIGFTYRTPIGYNEYNEPNEYKEHNFENYIATCKYAVNSRNATIGETEAQDIIDLVNTTASARPTFGETVIKVDSLPPLEQEIFGNAYLLTTDMLGLENEVLFNKGAIYIATETQYIKFTLDNDTFESMLENIETDFNTVNNQIVSLGETISNSTSALNSRINSEVATLNGTINEVRNTLGQGISNVQEIATENSESIITLQNETQTLRDELGNKLNKDFNTYSVLNNVADNDFVVIQSGNTNYKVSIQKLGEIFGNGGNHYKGDYLTKESLDLVVGSSGDYAFVNTTTENGDILVMYIWDTDVNAWKETTSSQYANSNAFDGYKTDIANGTIVVGKASDYNESGTIKTKFDSIEQNITNQATSFNDTFTELASALETSFGEVQTQITDVDTKVDNINFTNSINGTQITQTNKNSNFNTDSSLVFENNTLKLKSAWATYLDNATYAKPAFGTVQLLTSTGTAVPTTFEKGTTYTVNKIRHSETNIQNIASIYVRAGNDTNTNGASWVGSQLTKSSSATTNTLSVIQLADSVSLKLEITDTKGNKIYSSAMNSKAVSYAYYKSIDNATAPTTSLNRSSVMDTFFTSGQDVSYSANHYIYFYVLGKTSTAKIQTYVLGSWGDVETTYVGNKTITKSNGTTETYVCYRTTKTFNASGTAKYRVV